MNRKVSKIPNHKLQIPNKLQVPTSNNQTDFVSNLGDWDLFEIWCLGFGASKRPCVTHYIASQSFIAHKELEDEE